MVCRSLGVRLPACALALMPMITVTRTMPQCNTSRLHRLVRLQGGCWPCCSQCLHHPAKLTFDAHVQISEVLYIQHTRTGLMGSDCVLCSPQPLPRSRSLAHSLSAERRAEMGAVVQRGSSSRLHP